MKLKIFITTITFMIFQLCLQSCSKTTVVSDPLDFTVLRHDDESRFTSVNTGTNTITTVVGFVVGYNGEPACTIYEQKGNSMYVKRGDELKITFHPSCPEEKEAYFTMPDGVSFKVTASAPVIKWTVTDDIPYSSEIVGMSRYEDDKYVYEKAAVVVLYRSDIHM